MSSTVARLAALLFAAIAAFGQTAPTRPSFNAFEVAAIKPTAPDENSRFMKMQGTREFVAKNYTVKVLIAAAYNLTPQAVSGGPAWVDSNRYDIVAATPGNVRPNLDEQM